VIHSWVLAVNFGQVLAACFSNHVWKAAEFIDTIDTAAVSRFGSQGTTSIGHIIQGAYLAVVAAVSLANIPWWSQKFNESDDPG